MNFNHQILCGNPCYYYNWCCYLLCSSFVWIQYSNYEDFQTKKRPFECGANLTKGGCCRNNCNCTSKKCNMNNQCD